MQNTNLEEIKQVCLTLAHGCQTAENNLSETATNIAYIKSMLMQMSERINEIQKGLNAAPVQTKPDPLDVELIQEWVSDNGYDFNDDFEEVVSTELDVNHYSQNVEISIEKSIDDFQRDRILEAAIERYLRWAAEQTIEETQEEGANDE